MNFSFNTVKVEDLGVIFTVMPNESKVVSLVKTLDEFLVFSRYKS
jgi:hypothetical protein